MQPEGPRQRAVAVRGPELLTWQSVSPADPSAPSSMPEVQGGPSFAPQVSRTSLDTRLEAGGGAEQAGLGLRAGYVDGRQGRGLSWGVRVDNRPLVQSSGLAFQGWPAAPALITETVGNNGYTHSYLPAVCSVV